MATLHETLHQKQINFSSQNESDSIFWEYGNVDSSYAFELIDMIWWREFLLQNRAWAFYCAGIYALTIFGLEKYMKTRKAFDLKTPLILWNASLGIFSIMGFVRTVPYIAKYMTGLNGLYESICVRDIPEPPLAFWGLAFALSKYVELGDTLFIVLRKRPLQTLQWYHHIATLIVVWVTMPYKEPLGRFFVIMNYGVHSVMYPYFALKMAGIDVPKVISNMITTAQFAQMIAGFVLNAITIALIGMGSTCFRTRDSIWAFLAVYGSFVILFGRLFNDAVLRRSKSGKQNKKKVL